MSHLHVRTCIVHVRMYVMCASHKNIVGRLCECWDALTVVWSAVCGASLSSPSPPQPQTHCPQSHTGDTHGAGSLTPAWATQERVSDTHDGHTHTYMYIHVYTMSCRYMYIHSLCSCPIIYAHVHVHIYMYMLCHAQVHIHVCI